MDETTITPTDGAGPPSSLFSRLINVFAAPGEVFEEVKKSPPSAANWVVPAVIYMLVGWVCVGFVMSQPAIRQQLSDISSQAIEKQIAARKSTKEQADQMRQAAEKFGGIGTIVSMAATPVIGAFVAPFWSGLLIWLLGKLVLKSNFGFMKAVEVAGLSNMIGVLHAIIKSLLIIGMGNLFASPSLILLVKEFDPESTLHSLLGIVNVMTFWVLAVHAVGLAKLSGASFAKAAACVFGLWVVLMAALIGFGLAIRSIMHAAFGG